MGGVHGSVRETTKEINELMKVGSICKRNRKRGTDLNPKLNWIFLAANAFSKK